MAIQNMSHCPPGCRMNFNIITDFLNKPQSDDLAKLTAEQCTFKGMMKNVHSFQLGDKEDGPNLLQNVVVGNWKVNDRFGKDVLAKLK